MNFLVLRSGIYYFRKTYVLPEGKRKEIKLSLKTRDKQLAQYLALKMLYEKRTASQAVQVEDSISASQAKAPTPIPAAPTDPLPPKAVSTRLDVAITLFLAEKARSGACKGKESQRVGSMLNALVATLGAVPVNTVGKTEAAECKDSLLNSKRSITTINNYLKRGIDAV